jgi:hypothetical protein
MFRCPFQLGEGRDGDSAGIGLRMINFEQEGAIGLHDEGSWSAGWGRHQWGVGSAVDF